MSIMKNLFGEGGTKIVGALVLIFIFYYIYLQIKAEVLPAMDDIRIALTLVMFVWILNWMRKSMIGSPRLALLFALVVSYLVFFKHPNLLFAVFGMMFLVYFIKPFFEKASDAGSPPHIDLMNFYKDMAEKGGQIVITAPYTWPFYYPPPYMIPSQQTQQRRGGNQ